MMKLKKSAVVLFLFVVASVSATNYYVSTSGDDSNDGTSVSAAFATVTKGLKAAYAGDTIFVLEGTYSYTSKITVSRSGTADNPIVFCAYTSTKPIIDFSGMSTSSSNRGFSVSGTYYVIRGFKVQEAGDNGMHISGNYNTVENCVFYKNRDTGLQLSNGAANNRIINCDSYGNADPTDYADADGFACKMDVGTGNYFYGCRSWLNVDDGWDGYMRGNDDVYTTLENCWTWMNGYFLDGTDGGSSANGNGFKTGGSNDKTLNHNFTLINCIAFDNKSKGFDQNNNKGDMTFYNCFSFRNKGHNYSIPYEPNEGKTATVKNCISVNGTVKLGSFTVQSNNSWSDFSFDDNDFISLDTTGVSSPRKADGSLPDIDFAHLSSNSVFIDAGVDLGFEYNGSAPDLGAFETEGASAINNVTTDNLSIILNKDSEQLTVCLPSGRTLNTVVNIYNINGIKMCSKSVSAKCNELKIDTSSLLSGIYIVSVQSNEIKQISRFVY